MSRRLPLLTLLLVMMGLDAALSAQAPSTGNSMGNEKALRARHPATPEGKVDFSGVWDPGSTFFNIGQLPLQPWADELMKQRRANLGEGRS